MECVFKSINKKNIKINTDFMEDKKREIDTKSKFTKSVYYSLLLVN